MSEIEKMMQNAVGKVCTHTIINPTKCNRRRMTRCCDCDWLGHPPFNAEKQIELIKWLGKNKNGFDVFYDTRFNGKEKHYWCCADQYCEDFNYCYHEKEFSEALAGLINELPLTEEEKQQVKGILE